MLCPRCACASRVDGGNHAIAEVAQHLAAARAEVRVAPPPGRGLLGPALLDLREAQAFEFAEAALAQAGVDAQVGSLLRAASGAAVWRARVRSLL